MEHLFASLFVITGFLDISFYFKNFLYSVVAPKWILLHAAGLICLFIFVLKNTELTLKFRKGILYLLAAYAASLALTVSAAPIGYLERSLSEKFLFCVIALVSNALYAKEESLLSKIRSWIFYSTPFFCGLFLINHFTKLGPKFFHNTHNLSEFLSIIVLFQVFFIFKGTRHANKNSNIFEYSVFAFSLFALLIAQSRTAMLGLFVALSFYVLGKLDRIPKKMIALLAVLFFAFVAMNFSSNKKLSLSYRLIRWENSIAMIRDNPFGVGFENFASTYTHYKNYGQYDPEAFEGWILDNPHNSFIEHAAEEGLLSATILISAIIYLFYLVIKVPNRGSNILLKSLATFLLVDAFFNFPQDNPYTFFIMAFCFGAIHRKISDTKLSLSKRQLLPILGLATIFIGYLPARYYTAFYIAHDASADSARKACAIDGQIWHACLTDITTDINNKEFEEASRKLEKLYWRFGNHYPFLLKEVEFYWKINKPAEACELAHKYNALFKNQSSLLPFIKGPCSVKK